jgi:Ca2+-binding RTX toxin-like protein
MSGSTVVYYFSPDQIDIKNERFAWDSGAAIVEAGRGDDVILAPTGSFNDYNDFLEGHGGNDYIKGGGGSDMIWGDNRALPYDQGGGSVPQNSDGILGGSGFDAIWGQEGDDYIHGESGTDQLFGGSGDDFIQGGTDFDYIYGGSGNDTLVSSAVSNVPGSYLFTVDYTHNGITNAASGGSVTVEIGSLGTDDSGDLLEGGIGDDTYYIDGANDIVREFAGEGNDRLETPVSYTLGANASIEYFATTFVGTTTIIHMTGNGIGQTIEGNFSSQTLTGNGGNDFLFGSRGRDTLWGGANNDRFIFSEMEASGSAIATADRIMDFRDSGGEQDQIDVRGIDANIISYAADNAFVLDTDGSLSRGEIRQTFINSGADLLLEFNYNNDNVSDMAIVVVGRTTLLDNADFLL